MVANTVVAKTKGKVRPLPPIKSLEEAVRDAKEHSVLTLYEEKPLEKTPACFLKSRLIAGRQSHRNMIKIERKRRKMAGNNNYGGRKPPKFVFDDGCASVVASSIGGASRASSTGSKIHVPPFNDNRSLGSGRFSRSSRKYYGLSPELMDAASLTSKGSRGSYQKIFQDPPAALLPRGLQFGLPVIMNRSQAMEESENLTLTAEDQARIATEQQDRQRRSLIEPRGLDDYVHKIGNTRFIEDEENATGTLLYRQPSDLRAKIVAQQKSHSSFPSDGSTGNDSTNEFLKWYIEVERQIKRKRYAAGGLAVLFMAAIVTLVVTLTSGSNDRRIGRGDDLQTIVSIGERTVPPRPSPPGPPTFDVNNVPFTVPSGETWNAETLKAMLEAFSHSSALESGSTPQGKAYKWLLNNSNLENMTGMRVGQRYVLAVLYFTCRTHSWLDETNWLSAEHECTWYGIGCGMQGTNGQGTGRNMLQDEDLVETVTYINLQRNKLRGSLPLEVRNLGSLEQLILSGNLIGGEISADFVSSLRSIHTMYLDENLFTGEFPNDLTNLVSLRNLDLSGNSFRGSIPGQFAPNLVDIRLAGNSFDGQLPDVFAELPKLTVLLAGNNELSGSIPHSLAVSTSIGTLHLQENQLKGSIPEMTSTNLRNLHLDNNDFSGNLPFLDSFFTGSLEELRLEGNQLSGRIPIELGDQTNLKLLWLNSNKLTSSVPHELGRLEHLISLQLDGNGLTGSIPASLCLLKSNRELTTLKAKCKGTNPDLRCDCCDAC